MADKRQLAAEFAAIANQFVDLVTRPGDDADGFAERLLRVLTQLYAAALVLPAVEEMDPNAEFRDPTEQEWRAVHQNVARMTGERDHYWLVSDPVDLRDLPTQPCCGSLADDCADIYRDVAGPLAAFNNGNLQHVDTMIWEWSTTLFEIHWGVHATQAIAALHRILYE